MVVGVYGLGRFGSFWAAELAAKYEVRVYSRRPHPAPTGAQQVSEDELLQSDVVVLCVAISAMEHVVAHIAPRVRPGALVMDTCSIKVYPVEVMERLLPQTVSILGTHPMFGPDSARDGVDGLPMILTRVRAERGEAAFWLDAYRNMGLRVMEMSADDHDREAAATQGVTHLIGRVLSELQLRPSEMGTVGYEKLVELVEQTCNDSHQLFVDLQRYNPHTAEMRRRLQAALAVVNEPLDRPGPQIMKRP